MKSSFRGYIRVVSLFVSLGILGLGAAWYVGAFRTTAESMAMAFGNRRPEVELLRKMMTEDASFNSVGVDQVGQYWLVGGSWITADGGSSPLRTLDEVLSHQGFDKVRYHKYIELLRRIGANRVSVHPTSKAVEILFRTEGTLVHGHLWYLRWTAAPNGASTQQSPFEQVRDLADGWSIVEEQN